MKQWIDKQIHAKYTPYVLAFLIPFLVMAAVCAGHGIYPFGENSFLHIDMYHQYAPFFMEFQRKLKAHESLMFSWNLGLGSDFVATFAYYLASPVNWLVVFCSKQHLIEFMTVLVLLKIACSGLFFAIYLGRHFKDNSYLVTLVSMFYALSAYISAYSWNIMWLDCIMLAPLIILGMERLVFEKKGGMYGILLAVSILSNYYISIMICIFLVLYFVVMQIEQKKLDVKSCARFFFYSLLAGGMGAVLLIPEAIALGYSGSGGFHFPEDFSWYFSVFDELARHCMGVSYAGDNAVLQSQDGHFRHNKVLFVLCQLLLTLLDSSGQGLLAGLLGSNAELALNLTVTQTDFQAAFRHGLVLAVFVLILDLAVLVAKIDDSLTQIGIVLGVNLYGKVLAFAFLDDGILQALNGHSGVITACNSILLVRCAQFLSIPHHSCGQRLLAGIFGGNAELILILCISQINGQTVLRHGLILTVFVLVFDLAVLVTKGQRTGTGAARMVKGHGKLCRLFCFDRIIQTVDGHADLLGKAAIFLAILGLFVAYQIVFVRTRQVQILLVIEWSSFS